MSKSSIYAVNATSQTVSENGQINFGSAVLKRGCALSVSGTQVNTNAAGAYWGILNLSFIPLSAGTVTIRLYQNGMAIPGATATLTVEATTGYSVDIPFLVQQRCCLDTAITAVVSGVGITASNVALLMEKGVM